MKKNYPINNPLQLVSCLNELKKLSVDGDKESYSIQVFGKNDLRSMLQNKLYWKHVGEIADQTFDTRSNIHYNLKRQHLHPIYMAGENAKNFAYQANFQALCIIKKSGVNIDFQIMHNKILSSTDATTKEFTAFIESYTQDVRHDGIHLTNPKNYMREAMI